MSSEPSLRLVNRTPSLHEWVAGVVKSDRLRGLSGNGFKVLLAYLAFVDQSLVAWPGEQALTRHLGCSADTVARGRQAIVNAGLVDVLAEGGTDGRRSWMLRLRHDLAADFARAGSAKLRGDPPQNCGPTPRKIAGGSMPSKSASELDDDGAAALDDGGPAEHLFAWREALDALASLGFGPRDARRQVERFGPAAVLDAVAHVRLKRRDGLQVRNARGLLIATLNGMLDGRSLDGRVPAERARMRGERRQPARSGPDARVDPDPTAGLSDRERAKALYQRFAGQVRSPRTAAAHCRRELVKAGWDEARIDAAFAGEGPGLWGQETGIEGSDA